MFRGCLVVIARRCEERSKQPKQSLKAIVRLLRGACPEHHEILRYAQNDTKRRAHNDTKRRAQNDTKRRAHNDSLSC